MQRTPTPSRLMMHDCKVSCSPVPRTTSVTALHAHLACSTPIRTTPRSICIRLLGRFHRIIGAIIMTHGDNEGLVLLPRIARLSWLLFRLWLAKEGVKEKRQPSCTSRSRQRVSVQDRPERQLPGLEVC